MNSKKNKNKSKPNKPQTPNPPQKVEEPSKDVEAAEIVSAGEVASAQKIDLRVPEIISEVIPVVEVKETEDDSPNKPKRNRGKKKKHDKDDDENQEEKPSEAVEIIEIVEVETQEIVIEENVAPNSRKKKNKNKKVVDPDTKTTEKAEEEVSLIDEKKIQESELCVKEESKPKDAGDQEAKSSKKKNKKKKRNDSERSEKAEELSCTSAFQKLLIDDKTDVKTVENPPIEEIKIQPEIVQVASKEDKNKNVSHKTASTKPEVENVEKSTDNPESAPAIPLHEPPGKNKKKNKKDKKEPPKEKEIKDDSDIEMPEIIPITETADELKKTIVQESPKENVPAEDSSVKSKEADENVTPKAKIAKPVERKRKGKGDHHSQELSEAQEKESMGSEIMKEEEKPVGTPIKEDVKTNIAELKSVLQETKEEISDVEPKPSSPDIKSLDLPEKDKNKKRKKSPKPGKQEQKPATPIEVETKPEVEINPEILKEEPQTLIKPTVVTEKQPVAEIKSQDAIITEAFEELIKIPESDKSKKRKKSPKPNKQEQPAKSITKTTAESDNEPKNISPDEPPIAQMETKFESMTPLFSTEVVEPQKESTISPGQIEIPTPIGTTKELMPEAKDIKPDDTNIPDTKSKKKRKKSPKLPLGTDAAHEIKETAASVTEMPQKQEAKPGSSTDNKKNKAKSHEKSDIFHDIPTAEDIEIRSLKTDESDSSICDFIPDIIQHPRATSQDLIDDNNNTLIQEITIEEMKLQIPTDIPDTPFIQGSGETPQVTPECVFVGVQISEVTAVPVPGKGEQEKTDIKSKMMEVNQDMEELRLSIERSLAEFSAMEKSEGEIERKFQEKTAHTRVEPKSPDVKMPSELMFKQPEKIETPKPQEKKIEETIATPSVDTKPAEITTSATQTSQKDSHKKETKPKPSEKMLTATNLPQPLEKHTETISPPIVPARKDKSVSKERDVKNIPIKVAEDIVKPTATATEVPQQQETLPDTSVPPAIPARKDNKNKGKNKKKGKQETAQAVTQTESTTASSESKEPAQESAKKEGKSEQKSETKQDKEKQHAVLPTDDVKNPSDLDGDQNNKPDFEPIENFEDAMTSSADDINKTFEMIVNEGNQTQIIEASHVNPEIKIVAPVEDTKPDKRDEKINPVSPPKNLLGHPNIPVQSNRTDYKKEKNKAPNTILAKVKIKDAVQIEDNKQSKDTQTDNIRKFLKTKSIDESFSSVTNENDEFVYKYSFRKVFLQSACHVCKKELKQTRVPCNFCNLMFYCSAKHKDEDWAKHQGFCFAVSTIVHLKDQKHIYADSKNITGQDYRLLRMQTIVSCEKVLKRRLAPFEQEALLYPRVCAAPACREWRQNKLVDCEGCGQISFCSEHPSHFPKAHQRWCKSYSLYQKLVCYQQTRGRLEPPLPGRIMVEPQTSEKMNEVLASMYEEKIDMNDIQYAALTQIATAPLTTAYCLQTYAKLTNANGTAKKATCTVHVVGGELQFEADALHKWEVFLLHQRPGARELGVAMVAPELNPSSLPLQLLARVKLCENCRTNKRRVVFSFQDKTTYHDYWDSDHFLTPDIVCAFNPSIKRSSMYNGKDPWPKTINCILKMKTPFLVTAYTLTELQRDLAKIKECAETDLKVLIEPKFNSFASVRPDRNFISDDEMPLLFKNYCYMLVCGA
ncbi:titin isoform X2 [Ostrinia furnacalis]|uniref:titin isoform X2 n=1 Tax=Ostrinia furnacalis TaxID=93504 RepID=UPI00103A906B|nr:titin isoform X2 [Ostrinia furnacalis]